MRLFNTNLCGLIFFALAWLLSIHARPWINFHSEALALAAICLLVTSRLLCRQHTPTLPIASIWLALAILIPWMQYFAGLNFFAGDAVVSALYLTGLLGAFFVGYGYAANAPASGGALLGFMHALWVAALLSAVIGLLQWLQLETALQLYAVERDAQGRALGNVGQPNQLASLLLIGMGALAFVYESKVIGRLAFALGIAFMSFVLVLTQSRTGLLSVVILAVFLIWKRRHVQLRLSAPVVAMWALIFCATTLVFPYLNNAMLLADVRSLAAPGAINERYLIWQQITYAISQAPWVGYGWNQTATAQISAAMVFPGSTPVTYAHNLILDLFVWNGVPLGLLLTGVCGYWFVTRVKQVSRPAGIFAMTCLLPFAIHSMLEYPHAYAYFLLAAGVMAGTVEASIAGTKMIPVNRRWCWSLLTIWMAFGSYFCYEYLLIEKDFSVARFEALRIGITPVEYQIPDIRMSTHLAALSKATRQKPIRGMSNDQIDNMKQVALRFPNGPTTFRYALALGLNGDPAGATAQMAIVRGIYGERYYRGAKEHLRALQQEKYPELKAIVTP